MQQPAAVAQCLIGDDDDEEGGRQAVECTTK